MAVNHNNTDASGQGIPDELRRVKYVMTISGDIVTIVADDAEIKPCHCYLDKILRDNLSKGFFFSSFT